MARVLQRVRAERLQIMLNGEELVALDDFRFKRRMPSRASAVRELPLVPFGPRVDRAN